MSENAATVEPVRRIIVTRHAVEQARHRYSNMHIHPTDIRRDVEEAVAAGREAIRLPKGISSSAPSRRGRLENSRYAWTEDLGRVYVMKRGRDERNGHEPVLIVMTALQGARG